MTPTSKNARIAGFLYLLLVIAGPIRLMYIPSKLFVRGNASATANNIAAHENLFRLGIVSDLFCGTILIFVVLALYRLLKGVDQNHAVLMVILGGVLPSAVDFSIALNDAAVLILVRGADFLSVFDKPQRDALAMLFLRRPGDPCRRDLLGPVAFPLSHPCVQVALPAPFPGRLADHQRLRL
jgi:hypothetical protein